MAITIPSGLYFGFTKAEIQAELVRYKAEVKNSGTGLTGASQNGQSYTFGDRKDMSLAEWQEELQAALAYFGLADNPEPPAMVVDFRTGADRFGYRGDGVC